MDGTPEQKAEYLPRIASGELIVSFALTEPDAGSDAASVKTRGVRDGSDYLLSGVAQNSRTDSLRFDPTVAESWTVRNRRTVVRHYPPATTALRDALRADLQMAATGCLKIGPRDEASGLRAQEQRRARHLLGVGGAAHRVRGALNRLPLPRIDSTPFVARR